MVLSKIDQNTIFAKIPERGQKRPILDSDKNMTWLMGSGGVTKYSRIKLKHRDGHSRGS